MKKKQKMVLNKKKFAKRVILLVVMVLVLVLFTALWLRGCEIETERNQNMIEEQRQIGENYWNK